MNSRFRRWVVWTGTLSLLIWIAIVLSQHETRLFKRARRISSTAGWYTSTRPSYHWVSDHSLMYFRNVRPGRPSYAMDTLGGTAFLYDTDLATEKPLTAFSDLFNRARGTVEELSLSPDGTRVLWRPSGGSAGISTTPTNRAYCATTQGTDFMLIRTYEPIGALWDSESRHWMEFQWNASGSRITHAVVHAVARSGDYKIPVPSDSPLQPPNTCYFAHRAPEDRILIEDGRSKPLHQPKDSLTIFRFPLKNPADHTVRYNVRFPVHTDQFEQYYSCRGDKIAWVFQGYETLSPIWLVRICPFLRRSVRLSVTIWVSEVSGAGMHEIAYYDGDDAGEQPLGDIQWLPNDGALSFIYRNVLYTLPAQ